MYTIVDYLKNIYFTRIISNPMGTAGGFLKGGAHFLRQIL